MINNSAGFVVSERICRAVQLLERSGGATASTAPDKRKSLSLQREQRHALHELRELLTIWDTSSFQLQRHEMARALSALFQCLDHRDQSLRFYADQTLDAVFRKMVLKFQPDKVVAFLLSELSKRTNPARTMCGTLQKLSWTVGGAKAQRASTYMAHLLDSISLCLQRPEESIQVAVERHFPTILAQLGPSVIGQSHAEKAEELFKTAIANLEMGGARNRAASTVIAHLARFVPSILHKSFYQLSAIVFELDEKDKENRIRIAGALNSFRMLWERLAENVTENTLNMLRKLLCKVLCCLNSPASEVLVAALELLRECAAHADESKLSLFNFNPLTTQSFPGTSSPFHSMSADQRSTMGKNAETGEKFNKDGAKDDAQSVRSELTGTSKMSVWSSMGDLVGVGVEELRDTTLAEFGMEDLDMALRRIGIDTSGGGEASRKVEEEGDGQEEEEEEAEEDRFSVISAELFVDPLMNCFHQQKVPEENGKKVREEEGRGERKEEGRGGGGEEEGRMMSNGREEGKTEGEQLTPPGSGGGGGGERIPRKEEEAKDQRRAGPEAEHKNMPTGGMANSGSTFWLHTALLVAKRFLLVGHGELRDDTEVRISHKILAMDMIAAAVLLEPKLGTNPFVADEEGHKSSSLNDLLGYIGHDDDGLAISALSFAFNMEKWKLVRERPKKQSDIERAGELVWHLKKTLHWQRSANRLKGVFKLFAQSIPLLCEDDKLLGLACEYAICSKDCDYFLVKTARAEFLSRIRWSLTSAPCRRHLQPECLRVFLRQLFDPDPRVHQATQNLLPRLIKNAQFGPRTSMFSSFVLPQCFEEYSSHPFPVLLGLDPHSFLFDVPNSSNEHLSLSQNLSHVLHSLHSIAFSNFSECQSGFAHALATLATHFPPTNGQFASTWLCSLNVAGQFGRSRPTPAAGPIPSGHKLLCLLLECAECTCTTLNELTSLIKSINALFSGISENLLMDSFEEGEKGPITLMNLWGIVPSRSEQPQKSSPPLSATTINNNPVERYTLLLLRVLNLYYSVVAEERAQRSEKSAMASVSSESFVGGAAAILARPSLLLHSKKHEPSEVFPPSCDIDTPEPMSSAHSSKSINFSQLLGSGIRPSRPTSFAHSAPLRSFEPLLKGAYKSFVELLNPDGFTRFLAPLDFAMRGLCSLLEFANLAFVQPFLDELLLYQRMLMDILPTNSARLIHQLLKCLFGSNALGLNGATIRQNDIWDQQIIPTKDPLEMHLHGPLNNFTVFTAFVGRAEFTDGIVGRLAGWMLPNRLRVNPENQDSQVLGKLLHQFEPFITHLLKLYSFTISADTKRAILDCVCSLILCDVRYDFLDRNGKFRSRVLAQVRQLSPVEDAPLLANIFAFLCVLVRIKFMKFNEIENLLAELFTGIDHKNCVFVLEAMKAVLLDVFFNTERKCKHPEEHLRILSRLKDLLANEFGQIFGTAPVESAQCWIILMGAFRQIGEEIWADVSLELFSLLANHSSTNSPTQSPLPSPSRQSQNHCMEAIRDGGPIGNNGDGEGGRRRMFLSTALLSICSPTVYRPIDEFFHCLQSSFHKLFSVLDPFSTEFLQISLKIGPFLFILFNQMDEEIFLLRMSTMFGHNKDPPKEPGECRETALEFIGKNVASLLIDCVRRLYSDTNVLLKLSRWDGSSLAEFEQNIALFILFTVHQSIRAGKTPQLIGAFREHLQRRAAEINAAQLASVCPPVFAFWSSLATLLNLDPDLSSSGPFPLLPCHCQSLLSNLIVHNLCENDESPKITSNAIQKMFSTASFEFFMRLMIMEDEKTFRRLLRKLSQETIQKIIHKLEELLRTDRQFDAILHRFCTFLAKSENPVDLDMANRLMENGKNHLQTLLSHDRLRHKMDVSTLKSLDPPRFSTKELSQMCSNNLNTSQFYRILTSHAMNQCDFRQICPGLAFLGQEDIVAILNTINSDVRRQFVQEIFDRFKHDTMGKRQKRHILDALVDFEFNSVAQQSSADEQIFVLARLTDQCERSERKIHLSEDSVEKVINCSFVRILVERLMEHRPLPADYFKALKCFFSLQTVSNLFAENDLHTLRSLQHFLTTLWELVEKDIPRWNRLHTDRRQHWGVSVENVDEGTGEEAEQQLLKLFGIVQRIVFAAQRGMIGGEVQGAFRTLLRLSLLQRMAMVPEVALRLGWSLVIDANGQHGSTRISVPLVQIHMLNDPEVLKDFCWRALWLGWESRAQFEELWMSLFGVLSFTPTTSSELHHLATTESSAALHRQLIASSLAIQGLTNLLLQTLLFPNPGNPVGSKFVVKHRRRRENFLFLDTKFGELAMNAKLLNNHLARKSSGDDEIFMQNLESYTANGYGIGQTALYHLWSISGLLEGIGSGSTENPKTFSPGTIRDSTSAYLVAQSTELDTTSSVRALFDTFMHWLDSPDLDQLPMSILSPTLRSLSLLSDLFHDPTFYRQTFIVLKPLIGSQKALSIEDHPAHGAVIALLLKCASVLDWSMLNDSGETSIAKLLDWLLLDQGLRCTGPWCQFVRECALRGLLYLLQSLHLDSLRSTIADCADFLVAELRRMQRMTDILTDFHPDSTEYNTLAWAAMFSITEEALLIDPQVKDNFLRIVSDSFVDPRLPTWQKQLLTGGMESLVLHSCSYAPRFRKLALECFEIYQLQPAHLPFALSVYLTCIYRELQEGGEFAYALNKSFPADDFHKLLNVFSFYTTSTSSSSSSDSLARFSIVCLTADFVCSVWSKESVLECIWSLLVPPVSTPTTPKFTSSSKISTPSVGHSDPLFAHPLQISVEEEGIAPNQGRKNKSPSLIPSPLQLTPFDQSLIHLLHLVLVQLHSFQHRICMELASNFLLPKLSSMEPGPMAKCLALVLLCSTNGCDQVQQRVHFLLHSPDPTGTSFFKLAFPPPYIQMLIHQFIGECEKAQLEGMDGSSRRREMEQSLGRLTE